MKGEEYERQCKELFLKLGPHLDGCPKNVVLVALLSYVAVLAKESDIGRGQIIEMINALEDKLLP